MTDEEIIKLAEKTREEKYCKKNIECICEDPLIYDCNDECPIAYIEDSTCRTLCGDTIYEQGFLDGFKAGYKNGQDSMSDYVMELQHAAYND